MKKCMIAFFILMLFSSLVFAQDRGGGFAGSENLSGWYGKSIAFVVGIDSYSQGWPRLSQAVKDAQRMEAALKARGFTVYTVYDKQATYPEMVNRLRKAAAQSGPNDAFLFYFAGHGYTQKSAWDGTETGFLVPVDARSGDTSGYLSVSQLRDEITTQCNARHVMLVLDSCFSGTLLTRAQLNDGEVADYLSKRGIFGITAGMQDQPAVDGLFTTVMIQGLDGNADYNDDGYVTFKELGLYAEQNVKARNRAQTPDYGVMYGAGQFVFKRPGGVAVPRQAEKVKLDFGKGASVGTVYEAPDVSDYDKLLQDAERQESEKKKTEEARKQYFAALDIAWGKVAAIVDKTAVPKDKRVAVVKKFLSEFPQDNPRKGEAEGLIRQIEAERAPEPVRVAAFPSSPGHASTDRWGIEWISIPGGSYMMGCSPGDSLCESYENPRQRESIRAFQMMKTEVTQGIYEKVMGKNPSYFKNCGSDCPVEQVSWNDAKAFCGKVGGRLPTEAEWEYAARAGTETELYTGRLTVKGDNNGPELDPIAWYGGNSGVSYSGAYDCSGWKDKQYSSSTCGTHPVSRKQPNAWGLYDMLGNVWEWTEDCYSDKLGGTKNCSLRVLRGGSWYYYAWSVRASYRDRWAPDLTTTTFGFRCSRDEN